MPPSAAQPPLQSMLMPMPPPMSAGTIPSPHPYMPYLFPNPQQYMAYLFQHQANSADIKATVRDGFPFPHGPLDIACPNIDPQLLPPGQPVFPVPQFQTQPWQYLDAVKKEPETMPPVVPPNETPRRRSTHTPIKRKRSPSPTHDSPCRLNRKQKPKPKKKIYIYISPIF